MIQETDNIPQTLNIKAYRGDTFKRLFSVVDGSGAAIDLTGGTAKFQVKKNKKTYISLSHTSGITLANGSIVLEIAAAATASMPLTEYEQDLEIVLDGRTVTYFRGLFSLEKDVSI